MKNEEKSKAFEVGNKITSDAMKAGKDVFVQFKDFLDWLIDTFALDLLIQYEGDYERIFNSRSGNAVFLESLFTWFQIVNEGLKRHECIDFFGEVYETMFQSSAKAHRNQQYFTPDYIFDFIARIQINEGNSKKMNFCSEPSCGSGRGLLKIWQEADWKDKFFFYAEDLDPISVKMCALNMMINGMHGWVICHNTLFPEDFKMGYAINEVRHPYPCNSYSIRKISREEFIKASIKNITNEKSI